MNHSPIRGMIGAVGICRIRNIEPDCGVVPSESPCDTSVGSTLGVHPSWQNDHYEVPI
jgi:hypothetical protein